MKKQNNVGRPRKILSIISALIQIQSKENIKSTLYVCNERMFDGLPSTSNEKHFLKKAYKTWSPINNASFGHNELNFIISSKIQAFTVYNYDNESVVMEITSHLASMHSLYNHNLKIHFWTYGK